MISVIIPVLNERLTVAQVVAFARRDPLVGEVVVIDDGSLDGTPDLARAAGARVITSTFLGKGASMEEGMRVATHPTVLYLDGDLTGLHPELIERMARPILKNEADFVKARFTREAGRVTALTARPLLRTFFPELSRFQQPLAGVIAARRSLLRTLRFENDYGVDVGLLIDVASSGARLAEVDIGHIEHDSHPLTVLEEMATQVARAILTRAARLGRLKPGYITDVQEAERHAQADLPFLVQRLGQPERLALFDMDGVLLRGRFVVELAHRTRQGVALSDYLDNPDLEAEERTRRIAGLFHGVARDTFQQTALEMPLTPGAREVVLALRGQGYRVGIVTDSYRVAAEVVRRRVFADFCVAHLMRFAQGRATGRLTLSPAMEHSDGCSVHPSCKVNVLRHLTERLGIEREQVLAVGDGENDICMLRAAGRSVAFHPRRACVRAAAQHVVEGGLTDLLTILDSPRSVRGAG
ncbi:MAG: HAD-IB family phosphatase [Gemmataceae bacterium]|nr:HAD-IB family phosphatase [Gemmataceae bacterium]